MKIRVLALCLGLLALHARSADLPSFRGLPGHLVLGQCAPFSEAAVLRLQAQGIPARQVLFKISRGGGVTTWHAALLFQHEGRFYFMDNQHVSPVRVGQTTDLGCVSHVYDGPTFIKMTDREGNRIAPKKMAELFAPPADWLKYLRPEITPQVSSTR